MAKKVITGEMIITKAFNDLCPKSSIGRGSATLINRFKFFAPHSAARIDNRRMTFRGDT